MIDDIITVTSLLFKAINKINQKRKGKKKYKGIEMDKKILFNLSGHRLHPEFIRKNPQYFVVDIPIKNVENVVKDAADLIIEMHKHFDLELGGYDIIAAGFSPLANTILVMLHGITGYFPNLILLKRNQENLFIDSELIRLQEIRNLFRQKRFR